MQIGNLILNGYAALAPMAGVADRAFRELCMCFGAGYCVSEMVSSKGIAYNSKKSAELMELSAAEHPVPSLRRWLTRHDLRCNISPT